MAFRQIISPESSMYKRGQNQNADSVKRFAYIKDNDGV